MDGYVWVCTKAFWYVHVCVLRGGGGTTECMGVHECGLVHVSGWGTSRGECVCVCGGGGHECVLARTCVCVCVCCVV